MVPAVRSEMHSAGPGLARTVQTLGVQRAQQQEWECWARRGWHRHRESKGPELSDCGLILRGTVAWILIQFKKTLFSCVWWESG